MNDGSTDNFAKETLEELSRRDERVRVINTENGGAAAARNIGMAAARGEYLAFADSDDEYLPGALQYMLDYAHKTNADVAVFGHKTDGRSLSVQDPVQRCLGEHERREFALTSISSTKLPADLWPYMHTGPWAKLFRRSMFVDNEIHFPVGSIMSEDAAMCLYAYDSARVIAIDTTLVYDYRSVPTSLSHAEQPLSNARNMIRLVEVACKFIAERHPGDKDFEAATSVGACLALLNVSRRCIQPALRTPGNEREAWQTWNGILHEPYVNTAIRRLRIGMLTRLIGWKRRDWGSIFKAWLLSNGFFRLSFRLIALNEKRKRIINNS